MRFATESHIETIDDLWAVLNHNTELLMGIIHIIRQRLK